jgi:hypothetical protein
MWGAMAASNAPDRKASDCASAQASGAPFALASANMPIERSTAMTSVPLALS